jgi:ribA/ribD-fused uncharacterized protein
MYHKFTFFYQSFSPFSQWYKKDFNINSITFNCCEQYMMYCKAMLFDDTETAKEILETEEPRDQKALGRKVKNFEQITWDLFKQDIVYKGNYAKFAQNPDIKKYLFATCNTTIVESSKFDKIWGIGIGIDDPARFDIRNWDGENLLGYALTLVREDILKEEKAVQVINDMWKTITGDVYLKDFTCGLSDTNTEVLNELSLHYQQITIENKDENDEGVSILSLMSTWTDLLVNKRLVALTDGGKSRKIVGWKIMEDYFSYPFIFKI